MRHPFTGKWYLSFSADGRAEHHGEILSEAPENVFRVSRFDGQADTEHLVSIGDLIKGRYQFFDSMVELTEAYERGPLIQPVDEEAQWFYEIQEPEEATP